MRLTGQIVIKELNKDFINQVPNLVIFNCLKSLVDKNYPHIKIIYKKNWQVASPKSFSPDLDSG
jgi:hypothetical protein